MIARLVGIVSVALFYVTSSAAAAVMFATFNAGPNVLEADSTSAENGDEVATWLDSSGSGNHATAPAGQRPVFSTNHAGTGVAAVANTGHHLTLSSAFITGNEGFTIKSRAFIHTDGLEHVFVNNWHQTANTSGIEFRLGGGQIGIYVGYAATTVVAPQQVFPAINPAGEFLNVYASRVGNLYSVGIDLNKDGDFDDIVSGVSESGTGFVGLPSDIIGSGHNLELGNIYYGGAPTALSSVAITVPEPSAAIMLLVAAALGVRTFRRV